MNLVQVGELCKRAAVAERDVYDSVVHEGGERTHDGGFLTAAWGTRGDEHACELSRQRALGPQTASRVPECLSNEVRLLTKTPQRSNLPSTAWGSCHNGWEYQRGRRRILLVARRR